MVKKAMVLLFVFGSLSTSHLLADCKSNMQAKIQGYLKDCIPSITIDDMSTCIEKVGLFNFNLKSFSDCLCVGKCNCTNICDCLSNKIENDKTWWYEQIPTCF